MTFASPDKWFAGNCFQQAGDPPPGPFFHQAMLPIPMAHPVDQEKNKRSSGQDEPHTNEHVDPHQIQAGKKKQQTDQAGRQINDILGLQPPEFDRLIDALVDFVHAV